MAEFTRADARHEWQRTETGDFLIVKEQAALM
jgi:hypothetical protein